MSRHCLIENERQEEGIRVFFFFFFLFRLSPSCHSITESGRRADKSLREQVASPTGARLKGDGISEWSKLIASADHVPHNRCDRMNGWGNKNYSFS